MGEIVRIILLTPMNGHWSGCCANADGQHSVSFVAEIIRRGKIMMGKIMMITMMMRKMTMRKLTGKTDKNTLVRMLCQCLWTALNVFGLASLSSGGLTALGLHI